MPSDTTPFQTPTRNRRRPAGLVTLLLVALAPLAASETDAAATAELPALDAGPVTALLYTYDAEQQATLNTAGDQLVYTTEMFWQFALVLGERIGERRRVRLTPLTITARQWRRDPAAEPGQELVQHRYSSSSEDPAVREDPLLGHLDALVDVPLTMILDTASGTVSGLEGEEGIIARLAERHESRPGIESPLVRRARKIYTAERLEAFISELFRRPQAGVERLTLPEPLAGEAERVWQGEHYTLRLPAGLTPQVVELYGDPTPVQLELSSLGGTGHVDMDSDGLRRSEGTTTATLRGTHQTQPVELALQITWQCGRLDFELPDEPAPTDQGSESETPSAP